MFTRPVKDPKISYGNLTPAEKRQVWMDIRQDAIEIAERLRVPNRLEAILSPSFQRNFAQLTGGFALD